MLKEVTPIIGMWSAFLYEGYGTLEDEIITFQPQGMGWFAYDRGVVTELILFTWSLLQHGEVEIQEMQYYFIDVSNQLVLDKSYQPQRLVVKATVASERTPEPANEQMEVITFVEAPFAGSQKLALATRDHQKLEPPSLTNPRIAF